jgi:HD superfamily phosphohydrolase
MENKIIQQYKTIYDCIHGFINLSNLQTFIIDSEEFQRLRSIKQLGSCHYVYHNAVHKRFEHSIGTSHLAEKIIDCIIKHTKKDDISEYLSSIPELQNYYNRKYEGKKHIIDEYIIELVKIAALCHDVGHGPFSHIFDDIFLNKETLKNNPRRFHEVRSGILLERIIKKNSILNHIIHKDEIIFLKNLINPKSEHTGFLYQIVSNNLNGLDVDKFDYLARDTYMMKIHPNFKFDSLVERIRIINNTICYPEQSINDIERLYDTRYKLHKTVCNHKGVISSQFMLTEILEYLDPVIKISESINDMDKFIKITDEYILTCYITLLSPFCKLDDESYNNICKARDIIKKLNSHELYPHIKTITSNKEIDTTELEKNNNILIHKNIIGFVGGYKRNPFDNIFIYNTKDKVRYGKNIMRKIDINKYTLLRPITCREHITMIFHKDKYNKDINLLKNKLNILFS